METLQKMKVSSEIKIENQLEPKLLISDVANIYNCTVQNIYKIIKDAKVEASREKSRLFLEHKNAKQILKLPFHHHTISFQTVKGGVGKTTTAINLATSIAMARRNVLLIDIDPQGNLTSGVGLKNQQTEAGTIYEALTRDPLDSTGFVLPTAVDNLFLIPANQNLTGAEIEMVTFKARERRLRRITESLRSRFDYIFIDCPPSLGLLTLNALCAADSLLVPLQCEFFALEGLSQLLQTVERVQQGFNSDLGIIGVVLTMFDRRNRLTDQVADDVRDCLGKLVFENVIPRNVRLSEAPSHGMPALVYDHNCSGSRAYIGLARELIGRLPQKRKAA